MERNNIREQMKTRKKKYTKIHENESYFFRKKLKIDKPFAQLTKNREQIQFK